MTALNLLPPGVQRAVALQDGNLRADLAVIPAAEAAGWQVSFRDGSWHNPADFQRAGVMVWQTRIYWQRARLLEGRLGERVQFGGGVAGLRLALGLDLEGAA